MAVGCLGAGAHGGKNSFADAAMSQGNVAVRGQVEVDRGSIVNAGDNGVVVDVFLGHFDDVVVGQRFDRLRRLGLGWRLSGAGGEGRRASVGIGVG